MIKKIKNYLFPQETFTVVFEPARAAKPKKKKPVAKKKPVKKKTTKKKSK